MLDSAISDDNTDEENVRKLRPTSLARSSPRERIREEQRSSQMSTLTSIRTGRPVARY